MNKFTAIGILLVAAIFEAGGDAIVRKALHLLIMMPSNILCGLIISAAAAQNGKSTRLACNLKAIGAAERPRYAELVRKVRAGIQDRKEVADGYIYKMDSRTVSLNEAEEWSRMERCCCPFLALRLDAADTPQNWTLNLSGPEGVKPLLDAEFPVQH